VASKQISELPYDQRRMILVGDKEAASPQYSFRRIALLSDRPGMRTAAGAAAVAADGYMQLAYPQRYWTWRSSRMGGSSVTARLLAVKTSEADALRFPVGHPLSKVVYVGHPIDPVMYMPMAKFHAFLFEHKVAEALRLIRSLNADTVDVIRVEGWDSSVGISLAAPVPGAEQVQVGATAGFERAQGNSVMARMQLKPSGNPSIPDNLVWLPHEPLWQEVVDARLTSGLRSFTLDVKSFDDYGVNARLNAQIAKCGLEAGGSFVQHCATLWRLEGTFTN
jgi:hypothetical protein